MKQYDTRACKSLSLFAKILIVFNSLSNNLSTGESDFLSSLSTQTGKPLVKIFFFLIELKRNKHTV